MASDPPVPDESEDEGEGEVTEPSPPDEAPAEPPPQVARRKGRAMRPAGRQPGYVTR